MTAKSTLEAVVLQTGRTGVITPVAIITPTEIGGVTVSRINMMNFAEVRKLGVNIGDDILIERMNDVIPRVLAVTKKNSTGTYEPGRACPECGKPLTEDGADDADGTYIRLICKNSLCSGRILLRIENYVKTIGFKGLGDKIIEKLFETGKLTTIADLYTLSVDDIASLEGSGEKTAKKLITQIQQKSQLTLPEFVDAIGLVGVGEHITELAQVKYPTIQELRAAKLEDLVSIKGVGELLAVALINGLAESSDLIDSLLQFVTIKTEKKPAVDAGGALAGKAICFTGCRPDEATKEKIATLGGKVASGVSKKTTHLVCMDTNSNSGKAKEARDLGLVIMSEAEFLGWLGTL
jgi:DNA ligase (NAD+)